MGGRPVKAGLRDETVIIRLHHERERERVTHGSHTPQILKAIDNY